MSEIKFIEHDGKKSGSVLEPRATLFRYLWYLMYLVPEVPVVPVVPANLISDILVSPAFQKYITPMVFSEKINSGRNEA